MEMAMRMDTLQRHTLDGLTSEGRDDDEWMEERRSRCGSDLRVGDVCKAEMGQGEWKSRAQMGCVTGWGWMELAVLTRCRLKPELK